MNCFIIKRSVIASCLAALAAGLLAPSDSVAQDSATELDAEQRAHAGE